MDRAKFVIIGITDHPAPWFPPEVQDVIRQGKVFSGGKRHHDIVAPLLPADAQWIDITAPLDAVFEQYVFQFSIFNFQRITIFASGDPLFFGFANTIKQRMPEAEMIIYPTFNSLQLLAHQLLMQMNEDDSKVNIFHHVDKQQSAVIMQVEEDDEMTVIVFSGKFTLDDVMKMTQ